MTLPVSLNTALALLAVDPALGGCLLRGADGETLELAAGALASLLPRAPAVPAGPRVLRLPISPALDHLLGGLDLEATVRARRRVLRPGLLAAHDGGVLWLPDPDLLDPAVAGPLVMVLQRGVVEIERDGLSARLPARLLLLLAAAPPGTAPGAPRFPALLDRAGLWLPEGAGGGRESGKDDQQPGRGLGSGDNLEYRIQNLDLPSPAAIADARARQATVSLERAQIASLAAVARRLEVEGLRPDWLACRVACASAALAGRVAVSDDDLALAVALVLAPRATTQPAPAQAPPPPPRTNLPDGNTEREATGSGAGATSSGDGTAESSAAETPDGAGTPERGESGTEPANAAASRVEQLIAAQAAYLPAQILAPPPGVRGRPVSGPRGGGRHARGRLAAAGHGRPGPAWAGARRPVGASLDLAATLEAAARRLAVAPAGTRAHHRSGAAIGAGSPLPPPNARLQLAVSDLRWRRPLAPPGVLFILAVDASGSMARNRLGAAKGAALLLLERAYRHRDRVALIAVRGPQATLLLPPTRSLARARRLLERLPAGGGTPLASALALGTDVAAQAARAGYPHAMLVLLTDGRANVPLAGPSTAAHIAGEIAGLARRWAALTAAGRAATLVVDTRLRFLGEAAAGDLAAALGGRYLYLPQAGSESLRRSAETAAADLGWRG